MAVEWLIEKIRQTEGGLVNSWKQTAATATVRDCIVVRARSRLYVYFDDVLFTCDCISLSSSIQYITLTPAYRCMYIYICIYMRLIYLARQ